MPLMRSGVEIIYNGVDISRDISGDLIGFSYTDNESGKADDISISLKDDDGLWADDWYPSTGDTIECTIVKIDQAGAQARLPLGAFSIDDLESADNGGQIFSINAVSVPVDASIRRQKKSRAWEDVALSEIAGDMAANASLQLVYLATANPLYDRRDQREESDLQFLLRLCEDEALSLKVTDKQLVVFSSEEREMAPPVATIYKREGDVISYSFKAQAHDIYYKALVEYSDPLTGDVNSFEYVSPELSAGKTLKIVKRATSIAEAERIAAAAIRQKNRLQTEGSITLVGEVIYVAGATIELLGFGKFSGVYLMKTVKHSVGNGHTSDIEITRVGVI